MNTMLAQELQDRGVTPTPQRLAVYASLKARRDHPSVDAVFRDLRRSMPTLSKTTVYATMQLLTEKGLIGCVHVDGDEVRYDGFSDFHAHFRCRECETIFDVMPETIPPHPLVRVPDGFQIYNEELTYYGLCPNCKNKKN